MAKPPEEKWGKNASCDVVRICSLYKVAVVYSRRRRGIGRRRRRRRRSQHKSSSPSWYKSSWCKYRTLPFRKSRERPSPFIFPHGLHSTLRVSLILHLSGS